jgi:hypothetical protein
VLITASMRRPGSDAIWRYCFTMVIFTRVGSGQASEYGKLSISATSTAAVHPSRASSWRTTSAPPVPPWISRIVWPARTFLSQRRSR